MATLTIARSFELVNHFRKINILLNGRKIGQLANGEVKDFEVPAGSHTLTAKIDWCSSNAVTFTVNENEIRSFQLTSFAEHSRLGVWATFYYITFGANKYLNLEEKTGQPYQTIR